MMRGLTFILTAAAFVLLVPVAHAQEVTWPLPGRAPDILIGAEYGLDSFDHVYSPMHQGMVYGGLRSRSGAYFLRLIRGKRFGLTGFQGELEAYPSLGARMYAYASYAVGESPVYPRHRINLEVYRGLPWSLEASLGARFFSFPGNESVLLATGSVSYYLGRFLFSLKPFIGVNTPETSVAGVLTTRYYLSDNEEFLTGRIGAGFTPDERWIQTSQGIPGQQITLLRSQTLGAAIQKTVMRKVMFLGRCDVIRQEVVFKPGTYVLDVAIGFGLRMLL